MDAKTMFETSKKAFYEDTKFLKELEEVIENRAEYGGVEVNLNSHVNFDLYTLQKYAYHIGEYLSGLGFVVHLNGDDVTVSWNNNK
jgi:hypothetical protein